MKNYSFIVLFFLFFALNLIAQNQNNNWYFGNKAAVAFNNGNLNALTTSQMITIEGCASVSDPVTGNLQFYTDGLQIWDANNTVMPNGSGLLSGGTTSATQGVLIVPYPGNPNLYYVFTVDETINGGANGFRYSLVDLNLNNGLGDVIQQQKNVLIQSNSTERIAATKIADGSGYWIVIHERDNNCFKAYALTSSGLNSNPIVSNIGSIHSTDQQANGDATMGYMKFSPNGKQLAVALYAANKIELVDFDNCVGSFSNSKTFPTIDNPYGIEFSPDNSKLYFSLYFNAGFNGVVYQLDLSAANPSPLLVGISSSFNNQCMGALQLAPDNKIYISINSESWLSSINQPNNTGIACDFIDQAIFLPNIGVFPTTGVLGLPQKVLDPIPQSQTSPFIVASNFCLNDSTKFEISGIPQNSSILWNFGIDSLSNDTSALFTPSFLYPNTGSFLVTAAINSTCTSETLTLELKIENCDSLLQNCEIVIPNVFTPNNDGINDRFLAITQCDASNVEFFICNRWGNLVWYSTNKNGEWDGKYNGLECSEGVYFYIFKAKTSSGDKTLSGMVTLLR